MLDRSLLPFFSFSRRSPLLWIPSSLSLHLHLHLHRWCVLLLVCDPLDGYLLLLLLFFWCGFDAWSLALDDDPMWFHLWRSRVSDLFHWMLVLVGWLRGFVSLSYCCSVLMIWCSIGFKSRFCNAFWWPILRLVLSFVWICVYVQYYWIFLFGWFWLLWWIVLKWF